jgi:anti-sigma regulatory factor (Ser/Thr protein kinase)
MKPRMTGSAKMQKRAFAANQQSVGAMDEWVAEIAREAGLGERTAFAARVCIAELANNVIQHGLVTPEDQITVTIYTDKENLEVEFQDTARGFDPTSVSGRPAHSEAYEGGRGLMLIKSYASSLRYWHDGRSNHVRLTFQSENRD